MSTPYRYRSFTDALGEAFDQHTLRFQPDMGNLLVVEVREPFEDIDPMGEGPHRLMIRVRDLAYPDQVTEHDIYVQHFKMGWSYQVVEPGETP